MFLQNFHIFINKRAMLRQKITVQVTTLPDCDDITRFDGTSLLELCKTTESPQYASSRIFLPPAISRIFVHRNHATFFIYTARIYGSVFFVLTVIFSSFSNIRQIVIMRITSWKLYAMGGYKEMSSVTSKTTKL